MKVAFLSLIVFLLIACKTEKQSELEQDVFIVPFSWDFSSEGQILIQDSTQRIYLSKDFWNYLIRSHSKTSGYIFISPLYDSSNYHVTLEDTSFIYYTVDYMSSMYFDKILADSVTDREKENAYSATSFFIIPKDTNGLAAAQERIEQRLNDYIITPTVAKDFIRFKKILRDKSKHYLIVYKKQFVNRIYSLYK